MGPTNVFSFFEAIMGPICARVFYFGSQGLFVTASRCGPLVETTVPVGGDPWVFQVGVGGEKNQFT